MPPGDTARLYHRLTAYGPEREWDEPVDHPRVLTDFVPNVLATFPAPCKTYPMRPLGRAGSQGSGML